MTDDPRQMNDQQLEEWVLEAAAADPVPVEGVLDVLAHVYYSGKTELADGLSDVIHDALRKRHDVAGTLSVFEMRAPWKNSDPAFRDLCRTMVRDTYAQAHVGASFVDSVGFDRKDVSTQECLRRLRLLMRLSPGVLCWDKTWGFGIVSSIEAFYRKVAIDFEKKHGHELSFEYAAQVLNLLDDSHILAVKHRDPARLQELVKTDPAEVVRMLLRSYGPCNVVKIQELLQGPMVPAAEWKVFWAAARKGLKADKRVAFPSGRLEPLSILAEEKAFDERWFDALAGECNIETILSLIENLAGEVEIPSLPEASRAVLSDRLQHVITGASSRQLGLATQGLMMSRDLSIPVDPGTVSAYVNRLLSRDGLFAAAQDLPASKLSGLLDYLHSHDQARASALFLAVIPEATVTLMNSVVDFLTSKGLENETLEVFRKAMVAGTTSIEMILWLSKRLDLLRSRFPGAIADLLTQSVTRLQEPQHGERLKAAKMLRALFERKEWLEVVLGAILPGQRELFVRMLKNSTGWPLLERNAVLVKIVGLYPDLHKLMLDEGGPAQPDRPSARFTSWRSYSERQKRLARIIDVELPENGRDLALARSYGDLSENHAFKAAKEHQAMLVNQRDTIAEELKSVKGTAFEGFACEAAGVGTRVSMIRSDGTTTQDVTILGEWDSDEKLGIISCKTALASALIGHRKGDQVKVPGGSGTDTCRILSVEPLPPEIIAWAKGDAGGHGQDAESAAGSQ